jgi:hypothetical protein
MILDGLPCEYRRAVGYNDVVSGRDEPGDQTQELYLIDRFRFSSADQIDITKMIGMLDAPRPCSSSSQRH